MGVADGEDALALFEVVGVAEGEWGEVLLVDADDGEVEVVVGGVDFADVVLFAVGGLDLELACVADDVEVGGDEAVLADDEAGAEGFLVAAAAVLGDGDDGGAGGFGEAFDADDAGFFAGCLGWGGEGGDRGEEGDGWEEEEELLAHGAGGERCLGVWGDFYMGSG